jgi:WD40 repeat protein
MFYAFLFLILVFIVYSFINKTVRKVAFFILGVIAISLVFWGINQVQERMFLRTLPGRFVYTGGGDLEGLWIGKAKEIRRIKGELINMRNILPEEEFNILRAHSLDGKKILFYGSIYIASRTFKYTIMSVNYDGSNFQELLDIRSKDPCWFIAFSPNGKNFVFGIIDGDKVFITPIDNFQPQKIVDNIHSLGRNPFSPDGKRIIFSSKDGYIYIVNSDGTGLHKITKGESPAWSPDGKKIAFVRSGNILTRGIYLCDPDGENERFLLRGNVRDLQWSPDGNYILYYPESKSFDLIPWPTFDTAVVSVEHPLRKAKIFNGFVSVDWIR